MPRTISEVIDLAVQESRMPTYLLYTFSVIFVGTGVTLIFWSITHDQPLITVLGVLDSALFWPAMKHADKTRRSNIMLRTLEIPLSQAKTAKEAAEMLKRSFEAHFSEEPHGTSLPNKFTASGEQ
jgi:hypothetical protein